MWRSCGISIHALREESDIRAAILAPPGVISIHALREESDYSKGPWQTNFDISIHALREESDWRGRSMAEAAADFYPRSP